MRLNFQKFNKMGKSLFRASSPSNGEGAHFEELLDDSYAGVCKCNIISHCTCNIQRDKYSFLGNPPEKPEPVKFGMNVSINDLLIHTVEQLEKKRRRVEYMAKKAEQAEKVRQSHVYHNRNIKVNSAFLDNPSSFELNT